MTKTALPSSAAAPPPDSRPVPKTYLTGPQVRARYNVSEMTLHRWLKNPDLDFPKPIYIARRRYFCEAELAAWERACAGRAA